MQDRRRSSSPCDSTVSAFQAQHPADSRLWICESTLHGNQDLGELRIVGPDTDRARDLAGSELAWLQLHGDLVTITRRASFGLQMQSRYVRIQANLEVRAVDLVDHQGLGDTCEQAALGLRTRKLEGSEIDGIRKDVDAVAQVGVRDYSNGRNRPTRRSDQNGIGSAAAGSVGSERHRQAVAAPRHERLERRRERVLRMLDVEDLQWLGL